MSISGRSGSELDVHRGYYELLSVWVNGNDKKQKIEEFFELNKINTLAIYGVGIFGKLITEEILKTSVSVEYFIDIKKSDPFCGIEVRNIEQIDNIDAVLITAVGYFNIINENLLKCGIKSKIFFLDNFIYRVTYCK